MGRKGAKAASRGSSHDPADLSGEQERFTPVVYHAAFSEGRLGNLETRKCPVGARPFEEERA